jgi:AraC-like DNA-binding protein
MDLMDVLSEVLRAVRLTGAMFHNAEFTAPWRLRTPPSCEMAVEIAGATGHVILFHFLIEGRGYTLLADDARPIPLEAGDIVVFPHGDAHILGNGPASRTMDYGAEWQRVRAQGLRLTRMGGGGEITRFVCGYLACDPELARGVLGGLPPVFKVNIRQDASARWLESAIRLIVHGSDIPQPGSEVVLAKLSEALFLETLRRYIAELPAEHVGWLGGVRDPKVGKALALLHRDPARPWTLATLAREVGASRTVLAERFRHYLSEPPMAYLKRWRLQLGAQLLQASSAGVAEVAARVGYESAPAFNRAFKCRFGLPPARFRAATRSALERRRPADRGRVMLGKAGLGMDETCPA